MPVVAHPWKDCAMTTTLPAGSGGRGRCAPPPHAQHAWRGLSSTCELSKAPVVVVPLEGATPSTSQRQSSRRTPASIQRERVYGCGASVQWSGLAA
jgi:hypothetical protein